MQKHLFALVAAFVFVACGVSESDLEGTWKFSDATLDKMSNGNAQMRAAVAKARMTFDDGKLTMEFPIVGKKEGTYTVKSTDGNKLTVETESNGKKEEMVLEFDGDEFTTTINGNKTTLVRAD